MHYSMFWESVKDMEVGTYTHTDMYAKYALFIVY